MGVVAAVNDTMPVIETFGPTIQGEGPSAGRACVFVRFAGCNLSCSWCDSAFSWHPLIVRDTRHQTPDEIVADVDALNSPRTLPVVLTGGEPLLQQHRDPWPPMIGTLAADRPVWIETNGTIAPTPTTLREADQLVVSPKLANAGGHRGHQNPALDRRWLELSDDPRVHFKYVVASRADVLTVAREIDGRWPADRTWVMPEATVGDELVGNYVADIVEATAAAGLNYSTRLHVLAWDDERGR